MSARNQRQAFNSEQDVEFGPPTAGDAAVALTDGAAAILALQRSAGNRAVQRLVAQRAGVARDPGAPTGPAGPPSPTSQEMAGARIEAELHDLEITLGRPLSPSDREAMQRALAATSPSVSPLTLALTPVLHPLKVAEQMGPKRFMPDKLDEERYLLERFPRLFPELVEFFAVTNTTPTVNVLTLSDWHFSGAPSEAFNVYKYLAAKRGEGPAPARVAVTPSMFGDTPEDRQEAQLLLGSFNVVAERVHIDDAPGSDGKQYRLRVTDSLGLQDGQKGAFYLMSFLVGSKNVVLAEYLGAVDASGQVAVVPWSTVDDSGAATHEHEERPGD